MIAEKVQVIIELLKQGTAGTAAATDLKAVEAQAGRTSAVLESLKASIRGSESIRAATAAAADLRALEAQMGRNAGVSSALRQALGNIQFPNLATATGGLRAVENQTQRTTASTESLRTSTTAAAAALRGPLKEAAASAAKDLEQVEKNLDKASNSADALRNRLAGLLAGVSTGIIVREVLQATLTMERMNNTLRSVAGGSQGAAREFRFVREEAGRLGLELESTLGAYTKLSAAAKGTALEGAAVKEIFLGIAEAGTVLGMSAAQQEGALNAIQQMISKGTVAAEELRGQLGERLPGAFQIASRAMGVTTAELGKMLEQGQILAADFLPRFAAELRRTFGPDAENASQSLNAELNVYHQNKTKGYVEFITAPPAAATILVTYTHYVRGISYKPAEHIVYLLTEVLSGKGLDESKIDWPSLQALKNYCDQAVTWNTGSRGPVTTSRYRSSYVMDVRKSLGEHMKTLLDACHAQIFLSGGKFSIKARRDASPVFAFNESNILVERDSDGRDRSTFVSQMVDRADRSNRVHLLYRGAQTFNAQTSVKRDDPMNQAERAPRIGNDGVVDEFLQYNAVVEESQMERLAETLLAEEVNTRWMVEFKTTIKGLALEPMDVISVTHSSQPTWSAKPFRIEDITQDEDDYIQIRAFEYFEGAYI